MSNSSLKVHKTTIAIGFMILSILEVLQKHLCSKTYSALHNKQYCICKYLKDLA